MNDSKERALADAFDLLTRRAFVKRAGAGLITLLASQEVWADPAAHSPFHVSLPGIASLTPATPAGALQLPLLGDGAAWDQPEYYPSLQAGRRLQVNRTVQNADIDGDGFDELIARGPGGILVYKFDPPTGQWIDMPGGPAWSDANGWGLPKYYLNIMTADIDGDGKAELIGRDSAAIEVWKYDTVASSPTYKTWIRLPDGPPWKDGWGWDQPSYFPTIQCADIDGDGQAEILGRGTDGDPNGGGIQCWKYDKVGKAWFQMAEGPAWTDANSWNLPQFYTTIQCADVDGDGAWELLGRDGVGVQTWKYDKTPASPTYKTWVQIAYIADFNSDFGWNQPQSYLTIQCADIDGDGHAELMGRAPDKNPTGQGIRAYKYVASSPLKGTWTPMTPGPALTDAAWSAPEYYETIQCADMNADGRAELLARGPDGILMWNYDPVSKAWSQLTAGPGWGDAAGWNQAPYYSTIQTARIKGEPLDGISLPIIADFGFESPPVTDTVNGTLFGNVGAWNFGADNGGVGLGVNPGLFTESAGPPPQGKQVVILFNGSGVGTYISQQISGFAAHVEYVFTFYASQTVGEPNAFSRNATLEVYLDAAKIGSYSLTGPSYVRLVTNPVIPGAGAHTLKFVCTSDMSNANAPMAGLLLDEVQIKATTLPRALLLGRDSLGVKTWRFDAQASAWSQTSTAFPSFTGSQNTYYRYITTALGIQLPDPNDPGAGIRYRYNDLAANIQNWTNDLLGVGPNPVAPPPGVPVSDPDWVAVKTQIVTELTWVSAVNHWFGALTQSQIEATFLANDLTLYTVGSYLDYAPTNNAPMSVLSILALVFSGVAAVMRLPGLELGPAAAIAGTIGVGFSSAAAGMPGGGTHGFQANYNALQAQLANSFTAAYTQSGLIPQGITGGLNGSVYTPGDYGLLAAVGQMIASTVWNWPSGNTALIAASQRAYATSVFKVLFANYQSHADSSHVYYSAYYSAAYGAAPANFPGAYIYAPNGPFAPGYYYWLQMGIPSAGYPPLTTMQALFDGASATTAFPLAVPLADFYTGQNGWQTLPPFDLYINTGSNGKSLRPRPSLEADVKITVRLTRDALTGRINAATTLSNRGMTAANNVEITSALLGAQTALDAPPMRHIRLAPGRQFMHALQFAPLPAGQRMVLKITGRHLGGAFGISLRIKTP